MNKQGYRLHTINMVLSAHGTTQILFNLFMILHRDHTICSWYLTVMAQSTHGTTQRWRNLLTVLNRHGTICSRYYTEMAQPAHGTTQIWLNLLIVSTQRWHNLLMVLHRDYVPEGGQSISNCQHQPCQEWPVVTRLMATYRGANIQEHET